MKIVYFGENPVTGEVVDPNRENWLSFIRPVQAFLGVDTSNELWNSTGRDFFATDLADIYYRTESHGTSAYGQTNNRLLYGEINSNTEDIIEASEGNYYENTGERLALYLWDDLTAGRTSGGFPVQYNDEGTEILVAPDIFSMQPSILGMTRTENCPYHYRAYPNSSDVDTYNQPRIDIYGDQAYNLYGGDGYNTDTHEYDKVIVNLPLFAQKSMAQDYVDNGWTSQNRVYWLNSRDEEAAPEDVPTLTYYYNMNLMHNGTSIRKQSFRADVRAIVRKGNWEGKIARYYVTGNDPYNMAFKGDTDKLEKIIFQDEDGITEYSSWSSFILAHGGEWSYIEYTLGSASDYYTTNVTTNIPLWKDETDADKYLNNQLDLEDSLNQGKPVSTLKIRTGTNIDKTDNDTVTTSSANRCYQLNEADLSSFSSILWTDSDGIMTDILKGTRITNNAIDLVIGCYKFPFNINNYCNMGSRHEIKVGGYSTSIQCASVTGLKTTRIGNAFINPIFNNFLDYQAVNVFLYLPYYGMASIDFKMIINTVLSIDMALDPYNGSIKYYVKADDKLIEEYGAQVGMSVPLTGSDSASKQREIIQANNQGLSEAFGLMNSAGNLNIGGVVQGMNNISNINAQINAEPVAISKGINSPGVGMMDIKYPYLIFDIQENITPSNLYANYNYPCNRITTISGCSGWTEAVDMFLTGSMLDSEKNEITTLFNSGVIV